MTARNAIRLECGETHGQSSMDRWSAAKAVLRSITGSLNVGNTFTETGTVVEGYCDADLARNCDTRKATTGFGGGRIVGFECAVAFQPAKCLHGKLELGVRVVVLMLIGKTSLDTAEPSLGNRRAL